MDSANENVIRALARVMAEARAGNVEAVAIVGVTADGVPDVSFGGASELVPSVNIGMDMLKAQFLQRVMSAQAVDTTSIRRPVGHG